MTNDPKSESYDAASAPVLVSLETAAVRYSVTVRQLRAQIARGRLPASRPGKHYLVSPADVATLFAPRLHTPAARPARLSPTARERAQLASAGRIAMAQLEAHADTDRAPSVDEQAARVRARLPASPYAKPEYDALTDRVIYGVGLGSLTRAELVRIAWACLDQANELSGGVGDGMSSLLADAGGWGE